MRPSRLFSPKNLALEKMSARRGLDVARARHPAKLGADGDRIAYVFEEVRAEAEREELVGKRPRRLARVVAEPGARVVARRLLRIEGLARVARSVGLQVEAVRRGAQWPVPTPPTDPGPPSHRATP